MGKRGVMDHLRDRIRERLGVLGLSAHRASVLAFGRGDVIRDILNGRVRHPRSDTLVRLAESLGVAESWLIGGDAGTATARDVPVFRASRIPAGESRALPGGLTLSEEAAEYVPRPSGLAGARGIYAVFIPDDAMAPRFEAGELVYASENRPPRTGDYVLARIRMALDAPEEALVARLDGRGEAGVTLSRLRPPSTEVLSLRVVVALHKILTFNDLAGI